MVKSVIATVRACSGAAAGASGRQEPCAHEGGHAARDQERPGRSRHREQRALDAQLTGQPREARPEREAHRELSTPCNGADEQQVGHIRAGDEEHDRRDTADPDGDVSLWPGHRTALQLDRAQHAARPRRDPIGVAPAFGNPAALDRGGQVGRRRVDRHAGLPLGDDLEELPVVVRGVVLRARIPHECRERHEGRRRRPFLEPDEVLRRDADDREPRAANP